MRAMNKMRWLGDKLKQAKADGDKVYLAMHIPPGKDAFAVASMSGNPNLWAILPDSKNSWYNQFIKLTTTYSSNICGIFYGHTHEDELRRLYDSTGTKITSVAISCPGVSANHYNNPGFKLMHLRIVQLISQLILKHFIQRQKPLPGGTTAMIFHQCSTAKKAIISSSASVLNRCMM